MRTGTVPDWHEWAEPQIRRRNRAGRAARLMRHLPDYDAWRKHPDDMWAAYDEWLELLPPSEPFMLGGPETPGRQAHAIRYVAACGRRQGSSPYLTNPEIIRKVGAILLRPEEAKRSERGRRK